MSEKIIELAYSLCRIPSISKDEAQALLFLETWLKNAGFFIEKIPVDKDRYNIFAYFKPSVSFSVIFCSHIDTVAPFIEPSIDVNKNVLFGRGACDAKGIIAAMVGALLAEKDSGFDDMALLITVGEEEASDGARRCNEFLKNRGRFLVVGEPTELKAAFAQKGTLVFDLEAFGKEAHSAMPHLGDSAIHKLIRTMYRLIGYSWPTHAQLGETLINIGEINGGSMRNVLARNALAKGIMRISETSSKIVKIIEGLLEEGVSLTIKSSSDPFFYRVPPGFETFLCGFGSDAPYLKNLGAPLLIGPGSLDFAHKPNEHIYFHDIEKGLLAYRQIAHLAREGNL